MFLVGSIEAQGKPCAAHKGKAKKACLYQLKRDRQDWPRNPKWWEITQRRATPAEVRTLRRIAECEQPGDGIHQHPIITGPDPSDRWRVRWSHPGPRYVSAFGMFSSTFRIGSAVTGSLYPPNATPAEELAAALVVARRFGFSAWGCA